MRALLHYCYFLFFVSTALLTGCSADKAIKEFPDGVVQESIDEKHFDGNAYDQAYLLTVKSSGDRIFWFEKYNSGDKNNGLSNYWGYYANELIVKISDHQKKQYLDKIVDSVFVKAGLAVAVTDSISRQNVYELTFSSKEALQPSELGKSLAGISDIVYALPSYVALFDQTTNQAMIEYNANQWSYKNMGIAFHHGSTFDADIDGVEALSKYIYWRSEKKPVLIAVMDSGLDINHPALKPALFVNAREVPNNRKDDDGNGFIDDINGWNFGNDNNDLTDQLKHGTHVAGIIGAVPVAHDKMRGVCPGAKLMGIKIATDAGVSKLFDDAKALGYCQDMGVEIVNMSFGSTVDFPPLRKAVSDAIDSGMILVASAGNDGRDLNTFPKYPACFPRVITVASTNNQDKLAHDSNFETYVPQNAIIKIASPGVDIYSTIPGGGYAFFSGTSMAAPLAAGTLGVLKSLYPSAPTSELLRRLYESAEILPSLANKVSNRGRINLYRAMFQPGQFRDGNDIPYQDQVIGGVSRGDRIPYANWGDPGVTGDDFEHAYKICSMKQLLSIRDEDLKKHFIIMNDLDYGMRPAGSPSTLDKTFQGHLYGQGFTIENFVLQTGNSTGLFRSIGGATIVSLRFAGAKIEGGADAGIIAGRASNVLLNDVQVEGEVKASRNAGLFFGSGSFVTLINCYVEGTINSRDEDTFCGGFIGTLNFKDNVLQKCHASVSIKGGAAAGGIVARCGNTRIEETYAHAIITGKQYLGGLTGMSSNIQIKNCCTDGTITGGQICGGITGDVQNSRITNSYSFCRVAGPKWTGGLIGRGKDFVVNGSYFWSQDAADGAGGEPRWDYELMRKENFVGWWNQGTPWTLVSGFRPSLALLPRSGPSLY